MMIYWLELVRLSEGQVFEARLGTGPSSGLLKREDISLYRTAA